MLVSEVIKPHKFIYLFYRFATENGENFFFDHFSFSAVSDSFILEFKKIETVPFMSFRSTSGVELNIDGMPIHRTDFKETAIPE